MFHTKCRIDLVITIMIFAIAFFHSYASQAQEFPVLRTVERAIQKNTRNKNGTPGKNYWQNTADYNIAVDFEPGTRKLKGKADIHYTNNSPDTLKSIVFKLYPNLYKTDAVRNMPLAAEDLGDGVNIIDIKTEGKQHDKSNRKIRGTNMYISGVTILPGRHFHIEVEYDYRLNKGSFVRTGQIDSGSFFIAYFFPRIAVYDDIDGWNEYPYAGKEEFYNDFDNFRVSVSVPAAYQVWATGDLKNADDIFKKEIVARITDAEQKDEIIDIITQTDIRNGNVMLPNTTNTWLFEATNVTDFAFALSNHYVWQARSVLVDSSENRRTRVDAVYDPEHIAYSKVAVYTAKTVELISHYFPKIPFPFSHQTVFDGLDAMEYPMMVNNLPFEAHNERLELTVHEVFHSIFPFYVGTNETRYSFMDEGWATFSEFFLSPMVDDSLPLDYDISDGNKYAGIAEDVPLMTPTPQLYGKARFYNKDLKPALAHRYLSEFLGDKLFLKSTQAYINTWKGKHPSPFDFFNSIESTTGLNLRWFWKNWFFETNVPDLAISKVDRVQSGYKIKVTSPGSLAVPVHLKVLYADGTKAFISRDFSCWKNGNKEVQIVLKTNKRITRINLGDAYDLDVDLTNNQWNSSGSVK
ncbi:MAG: M1 family metallopeptidase [Flavitalea sp.]